MIRKYMILRSMKWNLGENIQCSYQIEMDPRVCYIVAQIHIFLSNRIGS